VLKKEGLCFDFVQDKELLYLSRAFRPTLKNYQPPVQRALDLFYRTEAAGECSTCLKLLSMVKL